MNTQQTTAPSKTNRAYWAQVVTLGLVVGLGLQFAQAWTAPTASAPNGNVSGPITTSAVAQNKQGILGLGGLGVTGATNLDGITTVGAAGTLKLAGKASCDLKTDASGNAVCGPADGNGDITGVNVTANNSGLTGGGASGDVSVAVNFSTVQKRVSLGGPNSNGVCAVGNAIRSISADGAVTCQSTGGGVTATNISQTLFDRSQLFSCVRDHGNNNKNGTDVCPIPPQYKLCHIERTYISDGNNDINGYGCYTHPMGSNWQIEASAIGVRTVTCNARCYQ